MRLIQIALAAALLAAPALAQQTAAPACAAMDGKLPADLSDWNAKAALSSVSKGIDLAKADIALGKGYEASLLKTQSIVMPVQPEKPGGSVSYSGLFSFTVETAGAYTVALGAAAWIDVIENGKAVTPTSFGHGPECTSIRKMVVFPLQPGRHVLQVSGNADPKLKLLVAKKP
jgi:hypothetical protein